MAEKDYSDEEIEELDNFLQLEGYYDMYEQLTDKLERMMYGN